MKDVFQAGDCNFDKTSCRKGAILIRQRAGRVQFDTEGRRSDFTVDILGLLEQPGLVKVREAAKNGLFLVAIVLNS